MNFNVSSGLFLQQTNGGGGATQSQVSSASNAPSTELRRRKTNHRSTLIGASAMASSNSDQRVKLERVIGMTVNSVAALASDSVNGLIAYPAGCTVVLYSSKRNRQAHIINPVRKNITCVAFSPDGNYIATAECGHQPSVRVWDVEERSQIVDLQGGHNFGVSCLIFSPDSKYLISVGNQHDNVVNVWNWRNQRKSSTNKVSCKVKAISFAEDGSYFVTAGVRHVKFWYLERSKTATPKYQDTVPLQGRSAILADQRNNCFCDVLCGRGTSSSKTFAITQSGLLCEFNNNKRLLEKWLDLKTRCAYSLSLGGDNLFVGCADGVVHVFKANGLSYVATMPRPHSLGMDIASPLTSTKSGKYPDVVATRYDEQHKKLTCVYNDHSLYQWEVGNDFKQLGKAHSSLTHGGCIWTIEMYPSSAQFLPPGTFFTGSSDDTIRIWNIDPNMPVDTTIMRKNIYSQELLKIIYSDPQLTHLCDNELASDKQDNQYDGKSGIRALKTSPDGCHLATGDRSGNLRIYAMTDFSLLYQLSAHDSEVLCLEYSSPQIGSYFLASSSRDRLLHVLDPTRNYDPVCTIDDHSSSIMSVKFVRGIFNSIRSGNKQESTDPTDQSQDDLIMLSGGADKSIIVRKMVPDSQGQQQFVRANYVALQSTVYDMDVDKRRNTVLAACQDRQIRVYQMADGKFDRTFKGASSDDNTGTLIKLELDPSCTFVATSTSDKQINIIDVATGDFVASMGGHGELVTGLKFSNDCRHLFTVSGDGCVFVWRLSTELTNRMLARMAKLARADSSDVSLADAKGAAGEEVHAGFVDSGRSYSGYSDFDEKDSAQGQDWARKKPQPTLSQSFDEQPQYKPRGRWASSKRPEPDGLESTESHSSARGTAATHQQADFVAPAGSVQKILKQFETEKTELGKRGHKDGGGDFGSLMNVRLIGVDDEDGKSKNEEVVYYPPAVANAEPNLAKDFVVKERSNVSSRSYRGAETMGDLSDDDGTTASSSELSLRTSESVGELHLRQHRMVVDAFEKLENPDSFFAPKNEPNLERGSSGRQSITSRYLQRDGSTFPKSDDAAEPIAPAPVARSRWNLNRPPIVPARILVTPSTPSPQHPPQSASGSGKSESRAADIGSLVDEKTVLRAKQLSDAAQRIQLRDRRQTFTGFDRTPLSEKFRDANTQGTDYSSSDLHQRSRSRSRGGTSPGRQHASSSRAQDRGDAQDAEQSSSVYRQKRKPPMSYFNTNLVASRSMSSLMSHAPTSVSQSHNHSGGGDGAMKRLADMREKLRKSQENIAFGAAASGTTTPVGEPASPFGDWNGRSGTSRSKSIGNLTFTAAAIDSALRKQSTPTRIEASGRSRLSSLLQSRGIALSVGNLRDQTSAAPTDDEGTQHRPPSRNAAGTPTNLVGAIMDFKKRSVTDLSQSTLAPEERSESVVGSFYGKVATMPRRYQQATNSSVGKKAQAIRSQRLTAGSGTDRVSISGESEDSSIDFYNAPRQNANVLPSSVTRSQMITSSVRHRLDLSGDNASSRSSSPGFQQQQQKAYDVARQIIDAKQRQSQNQYGTPPTSKMGRPSPSYLAKILNSTDDQDDGTQNSGGGEANYFASGGRHQSEASAVSGKRLSNQALGCGQQLVRDQFSAMVDSCDNHYDKMSGHCKDSVVQFRTSLDKVLQAYNMVVDDTDLTEDERDELVRMLSMELEAARERLNHILTQQRSSSSSGSRRFDTEVGKDGRSAVAGTRRHQPVPSSAQQPITGSAVPPNGAEQRDASLLLQEYSDMLVSLIQQKMSSSGK